MGMCQWGPQRGEKGTLQKHTKMKLHGDRVKPGHGSILALHPIFHPSAAGGQPARDPGFAPVKSWVGFPLSASLKREMAMTGNVDLWHLRLEPSWSSKLPQPQGVSVLQDSSHAKTSTLCWLVQCRRATF